MSENFPITSIADLERILDENREIRERLRRRMLTDEERELPRIVERLAAETTRLTETLTQGLAQAAADRQAIREAMAEGFRQAAIDRQAIREEMAEGFRQAAEDRNAIRQEMADGFARAESDRNAIRQNLSEFIKTTNDNFQLVNERLSRLENDVAGLKNDVQEIKGDIHQINGRLDRMDRRFDRIDGRLDNALGANYETKVRRNIGSIAGQFLQMRQVKILGPESPRDRRLEETIDQAEENGSITQPAYHDLWQLDLIIQGIHSPGKTPLLAAIEISITAGDDDIERAASRRDTLKQAIGETPVIPVVIAANMDQERQSLADRLKVTIITHPEN